MSLDVWNELKNELQNRLSRAQYIHWINPISAKLDNKNLNLYCPNKMIKIFVEKNFMGIIRDVLSEIDSSINVIVDTKGTSFAVNKTVDNVNKVDVEPVDKFEKNRIQEHSIDADIDHNVMDKNKLRSKSKSALASSGVTKKRKFANYIQTYVGDSSKRSEKIEKDIADNIKIMQSKTFNNFITGSSNSLAFSTAKAAADNPTNKIYSPMYVVGQSGLGKTHLLWAMGNEICKKYPEKRVVYVLSTDFRDDYVKILQSKSNDTHKKVAEMQEFYSSSDVLLIDDIQLLSGSTETLNQIFAIFNKIFTKQRLIAFTSDVIPNELKNIDYRLKTRFDGGAVLHLDPPDIEQRIAITVSKCKEFKFKLKERDASDIATYIAQNCRNNVREIEGALKTVASEINKEKLDPNEKVSFDFVKNALSNTFVSKNKSISPENIIKVVCEYYHITEKDLRSKKRHRSIATQRFMTMYLIREYTNKSFPEIASILTKHHTTIIHGCEEIAKKLKTDKDIQNDFNNLIQIIQ